MRAAQGPNPDTHLGKTMFPCLTISGAKVMVSVLMSRVVSMPGRLVTASTVLLMSPAAPSRAMVAVVPVLEMVMDNVERLVGMLTEPCPFTVKVEAPDGATRPIRRRPNNSAIRHKAIA